MISSFYSYSQQPSYLHVHVPLDKSYEHKNIKTPGFQLHIIPVVGCGFKAALCWADLLRQDVSCTI